MRISDWSADVCSSDLGVARAGPVVALQQLGVEGGDGVHGRGPVGGSSSASGSQLQGALHDRGVPGERADIAVLLAGLELGDRDLDGGRLAAARSEEQTSELKSLMRTSYAVFSVTKKITK